MSRGTPFLVYLTLALAAVSVFAWAARTRSARRVEPPHDLGSRDGNVASAPRAAPARLRGSTTAHITEVLAPDQLAVGPTISPEHPLSATGSPPERQAAASALAPASDHDGAPRGSRCLTLEGPLPAGLGVEELATTLRATGSELAMLRVERDHVVCEGLVEDETGALVYTGSDADGRRRLRRWLETRQDRIWLRWVGVWDDPVRAAATAACAPHGISASALRAFIILGPGPTEVITQSLGKNPESGTRRHALRLQRVGSLFEFRLVP